MRYKIYFAFFLGFFIPMSKAQQVLSPEAFLGYPIGTKFTPHYQIVRYFEQVAKNAPGQVKLIEYGKTNEGRPLQLAFISSAENIQQLDKIKEANLQLARMKNGNLKAEVAIVWLSYNVHGNEPSSSEAAMQTAFELITKHSKDWLQNIVVVVDPCLNPDGRDRYVNWFNTTAGKSGNKNPYAREHDEPWPGGRVNHYYYDLNRDWAWQTQIETKERIKVYNQWMPQVHVDFHEQGINEPYYFAPAAEPMHEVITPWQRNFQTVIGKNNAKYFDANGWYYFTKERFDLFYPSYGDTYPTYNGSIGMTYEQAGHSRGGLTIIKNDGEELTLVDRVAHHTTTSLSTVEVSSKNVPALLDNFGQYFAASVLGKGSEYQSYILTSADFNKLRELTDLLDKNDIKYSYISKANGNGFHYATNKIESVRLDKYTVMVSALQPKSLLAKVLLEPKSKLADTATYDITAWSLPYAYGVRAYAATTVLPVEKTTVSANQSLSPTEYAYYIPYHSLTAAKTMAALLQVGAKIYINEKEIKANNRIFDKGTILLTKKDNVKQWDKIRTVLNNPALEIIAIASGFSDNGPDMGSPDIKFIAPPRIACISGDEAQPGSAGEIWHFYEQEMNYPVTMINGNDLKATALKNFDVLILPDGNFAAFNQKERLEDLKNWIKNGGRLIAIDGAVSQLANTDWGLKFKKATEEKEEDKPKEAYENLKPYANRDRDEIANYIPGAIFEVELDNTHPLAFGYEPVYYTLKQNASLLEFAKNAWNVGVIKKNKKMSGFHGYQLQEKLKDGSVLAVQNIGSGTVIYFVDNPIFRSFWQNGKMLFFNAAFLVGNNAERL